MVDWLKALRSFPQQLIDGACSDYMRDQPRRRPTPGDIYHRVSTKMAFHSKHVSPQLVIEAQDRPPPTPDEIARSQQMMRTAGFTKERGDLLKRFPKARSMAEAIDADQRAKPKHWTYGLPDDDPRMVQLREGREAYRVEVTK